MELLYIIGRPSSRRPDDHEPCEVERNSSGWKRHQITREPIKRQAQTGTVGAYVNDKPVWNSGAHENVKPELEQLRISRENE